MERTRGLNGRRLGDPSPAEIEAATAEFRKTWSPATFENRRQIPLATWVPPVVATNELGPIVSREEDSV